MGYYYTLDISSFPVTDSEKFLAEIRELAPEIGDEMEVENNIVTFDPPEAYSKWRCAEDDAAPVIMKFLPPGETCEISWIGEEGEQGGYLLTCDQQYNIRYTPVVDLGNGEISLCDAINIVKGVGEKTVLLSTGKEVRVLPGKGMPAIYSKAASMVARPYIAITESEHSAIVTMAEKNNTDIVLLDNEPHTFGNADMGYALMPLNQSGKEYILWP